MDEIDLKILTMIQRDGRLGNSAIARAVHLSVTAVARRLERLEDSGILLGRTARVDSEKAGLGIHGFILANAWQRPMHSVYAYLDTVPEITRVETIVSGGRELLLEFFCRDTDALMQFYDGDLRSYLESMTVYLVKGPPHKDAPLPLAQDSTEES